MGGRNVSRGMGSPFRKIISIESYAETFDKGFSRNSSKSACLPTSTVPRSFSRPNASALSSGWRTRLLPWGHVFDQQDWRRSTDVWGPLYCRRDRDLSCTKV